jgi:hypothetical protein
MPKLDLRIRDLNTGETVYAGFESEVDAAMWLRDRPKFTEVLGVTTHGLPEDVYKLLRGAARPLDPEEEALKRKREKAADEAKAKAAEEAKAKSEAEMAAWREAQKVADPNRPMTIRWSPEDGCKLADPDDPREITAEASAAVKAWVEEREEWLRARDQLVDEAEVTVWPGPLPKGESRVAAGGQFWPRGAPPKT